MASNAADFIVNKRDLRECRFVDAAEPDQRVLQPGQVLLRVDRFAFTSNNITYAVAGEGMKYWDFFPAEEGWGRVPVWGFGDVIRSRHDGLGEGERVFGYFPMSTHLVLRPGAVSPGGFVDASPHRAELPAVYNQYTRVANDPGYQFEHEDQQILFWPLFMTSFLLDDFLDDNGFFDARAVVLASTSSKTAFGLAFLLHRNRRSQCRVIGLTSPSNVSFVAGLGCYDQVVAYDKISSLPDDLPVVLVDMAGNGRVLSELHHHFRDHMKHSCRVGATHWEQNASEGNLPGARPAFFFAPNQIQKRAKDWGPGGIQKRFAQAWQPFLGATDDWTRIVHGSGHAAVEKVYRDMLEGRSKPDEGHVLSL